MVGLPRSGTTIVANYINSLNNAFCFIEPHWEFTCVGSPEYFHDPKLRIFDIPKVRRYLRLHYLEDASLPLDQAMDRILWRYDLVGIKETFRGDHYSGYDPKLPNEALLGRYLAAGYRLIPILRHPLAVWNSFCGHFSPDDAWAADLEAFIENYRRMCVLSVGSDVLIYERLVRDPVSEMARLAISSSGFGGQITTRQGVMGDASAKASTRITERAQPIHYTSDQRESLEASSIVRLYDAAVARQNEAAEDNGGVDGSSPD